MCLNLCIERRPEVLSPFYFFAFLFQSWRLAWAVECNEYDPNLAFWVNASSHQVSREEVSGSYPEQNKSFENIEKRQKPSLIIHYFYSSFPVFIQKKSNYILFALLQVLFCFLGVYNPAYYPQAFNQPWWHIFQRRSLSWLDYVFGILWEFQQETVLRQVDRFMQMADGSQFGKYWLLIFVFWAEYLHPHMFWKHLQQYDNEVLLGTRKQNKITGTILFSYLNQKSVAL